MTVDKTAVIDCQADAFPAARIEWRLSQGEFSVSLAARALKFTFHFQCTSMEVAAIVCACGNFIISLRL